VTAGRPRKFESPSELNKMVDEYFDNCKKNETPPGIYGLIDHLSCGVQTFYDYENDTENSEFSDILKKARLKVVAYAESKLYDKTAGGVAQLVNTTRKFPDPFKNAQHQEVTGPNNGPLSFKLLKADEGL
jgi:DNA-packaging protein gp3